MRSLSGVVLDPMKTTVALVASWNASLTSAGGNLAVGVIGLIEPYLYKFHGGLYILSVW